MNISSQSNTSKEDKENKLPHGFPEGPSVVVGVEDVGAEALGLVLSDLASMRLL